jgi:predicted membrane channel-forming protein YqfA (hemolysin III family)
VTKKTDKSLSALFFLVVGLLAIILFNNLKEEADFEGSHCGHTFGKDPSQRGYLFYYR